MIVFRICKARYADTAYSGAGGLEASGRWHHKGRSVVYASGTLSLAALEYLVHLGRRDTKISLVSVQATIPDDIPLMAIDKASLPRNWKAAPPIEATMALGDNWLVEARSAILKVPSVVVADEFNYLLNPRHPGFKRITVSEPAPFSFDPRFLA